MVLTFLVLHYCNSGSMKSMRLLSVAIFFMTYFYRDGGGHGPLGPPGSATESNLIEILV